MKTEEILAELAKRLRSRAEWCRDGWYSSDAEVAKNAAVRETLEGIAEDIEELLLPEPDAEPKETP